MDGLNHWRTDTLGATLDALPIFGTDIKNQSFVAAAGEWGRRGYTYACIFTFVKLASISWINTLHACIASRQNPASMLEAPNSFIFYEKLAGFFFQVEFCAVYYTKH